MPPFKTPSVLVSVAEPSLAPGPASPGDPRCLRYYVNQGVGGSSVYIKSLLLYGACLLVTLLLMLISTNACAQLTPDNDTFKLRAGDTLLAAENLTLPVVIVNSVNSEQLLRRIKNDTSFYKAFKTLRVVSYGSDNHIEIYDKKGKVKASYKSEARQIRQGDCRTTQIINQQTTGDFFNRKGAYNYTIGELFAGLFFAKGTVCGEDNIVAGHMNFETSGLSGIEKKKEQLKMLFFNPGRRIPGIPFIGDKLDLYDKDALKKYNYRLDTVTYGEHHGFEFTITPKPGARGVVIDYMRTIFDAESLDVLYRSYSLSYKAGVYNFDVKMQVKLDVRNGLLVPVDLHYKGNWSVLFKGRERASFSARLSDFN